MAQIPPWLNVSPMDFVNASATGARLGLERAGQTIGQDEANKRLGLGYAQLGASQGEAAQRIAAERENAAAQLAQHMLGFQSLEANRQSEAQNRLSEESHRTAAEALANRHQLFLEEQAKKADAEAKSKKYFHVAGGLYSQDPATGKVETIVAPGQKYDQLDLMNLKVAHEKVKNAQEALSKATDEASKTAAQQLIDINERAVTALEKKMRGGGAASSISGDDFFKMNLDPNAEEAAPAALNLDSGLFPAAAPSGGTGIKVLKIEPVQ